MYATVLFIVFFKLTVCCYHIMMNKDDYIIRYSTQRACRFVTVDCIGPIRGVYLRGLLYKVAQRQSSAKLNLKQPDDEINVCVKLFN